MPQIEFTERQIQAAKSRAIVTSRTVSPQYWRFLIKNGNLHWNGKVITKEWALKFAYWIIKELE